MIIPTAAHRELMERRAFWPENEAALLAELKLLTQEIAQMREKSRAIQTKAAS